MNAFVLVLNSLWEGAALAALTWLIVRSMPRINAATRYAIWWAALIIVLLLPAAPSLAPRPRPAPAIMASNGGTPVNPLLPEIPVPAIVTLRAEPSSIWPRALTLLWGSLFIYYLSRIAGSWLRLRGVKARAVTSTEALPTTGRAVRLLLSREVSSPIAVGFRHPAVILPESLPAELERNELDHVLLHESAHLARFDDWQNLAARLIGSALALHPVGLWILRQIEREREFACDEWVVARTGEARSYAASLARMYERRWSQEEALAAGMFGRGSTTVGRIEAVLRRGRASSSRVSIGRIAGSCAFLMLLVAASSYAPPWIALAQQPPRPAFEVASVKPGEPGSVRFGVGVRNGQFVATNAPLKMLIGFAYDVQYHQMFGGPKWMDSERFTIEGKPSASARIDMGPESMASLRLMVQTLLGERFRLVLHRETRTQPVYLLTIARGGPKLKATAQPDATRHGIFGGKSELNGTDTAIAQLVSVLSQRLDRPVVDGTGLSGKYDFKLTFAQEPSQSDLALFGAPPPGAQPAQDTSLPSIFTALPEQLGLRLESAKGPVEVLVIDRAQKPDAN